MPGSEPFRLASGPIPARRLAVLPGQLIAGAIILGAMVLLAVLAPVFWPGDPLDMVAPPSLGPFKDSDFPFGSDMLGRDLAAGVAHGASASLLVGVIATGVAVLIGTGIGLVAGQSGGWRESLLMRLVDVFESLPNFVVLIAVVAILRPPIELIAVFIGLLTWGPMARVVRGEFRSLRGRDFVLAARGMGQGPLRIALVEILPNAIGPVIVLASVLFASAILMESGLSFMGLSDPDRVTWGTLIALGSPSLRSAWYLTLIPGAAIVLTVIGANLLGDGLNRMIFTGRREGSVR